jgi:hypothetical protein
MMQRHSWYLSQEIATLALFSQLLTSSLVDGSTKLLGVPKLASAWLRTGTIAVAVLDLLKSWQCDTFIL